MIPSVADRRAELEGLCVRYGVQRLALRGSAATRCHAAGKSDLDFAGEFRKAGPGDCADACFGLLESVQDLFKSPADLVVGSAIKNPYSHRSVEMTRTPTYEARSRSTGLTMRQLRGSLASIDGELTANISLK